MCGRVIVSKTYEDMALYINQNYSGSAFSANIILPNYNIAPNQNLVTLIYANKSYRAGLLKWGLKLNKAKPVINIRKESFYSKPYFKQLLNKQRCLILVDGFYEWKKEKELAQPYRIYINNDLFALAGVWMKNGDHFTCSIITTPANAKLELIHPRMPVIFNPLESKKYLLENNEEKLFSFLKTKEIELLDFYPVTTKVNSALFTGEECIKPLTM